MNTLALLQNIGTLEWIVILALGLLLFGRRLPEVGRSLGKGIVEFKKGLKSVDDDIDTQSSKPSSKDSLTASERREPLMVQPLAPATSPDTRVSRSDQVE